MKTRSLISPKRIIVSIVVGAVIMLCTSQFFRETKTYIDTDATGAALCLSVDSQYVTSTTEGFPITFVTTYQNSCVNIPNDLNFWALLADTVLWSAPIYAVLTVAALKRAKPEAKR